MKPKFSHCLRFTSFALIAILSTIISCNNSSAQKEVPESSKVGIKFYNGSLDNAVTLAKQENKPMFIMVHASWCAVCKKMKKEILPQKDLGDIYNTHFINVMVDFDSEDGKMLKKQFEIVGTPTFLFLTADGQVLNRTSGFQEASDLIAAAKNLKVDGKAVCN